MKKNQTKAEILAELENAQKRIAELESNDPKKSEERFARVFRACPSQMSLADSSTGKYVEVNEAFLKILGFKREEVIGRTTTELNLFVDPAQCAELLQRMAAKGSLRDEYVLVRAKSGEIRHGLFFAEYVHTQGTKLLLMVINDVTEQMKAEERWHFALEGAGDGMWDWNPQTNKVFFSRQWKSMLGYEEHEIGDTLDEWSSRVHPDDLAAAMEQVNAHLLGQTPAYASEHRLRCKDGSYKWIIDRGKVIEWAEDKKPLRVVGTHKDITERKGTEKKLRESEQRFSRVFHANPAAQLIVIAESGIILNCNEAFCQQTGYTHAELVGRTTSEAGLWHNPSQQMEIIQRLQARQPARDIEVEFRTKSGKAYTLLISFDAILLNGVQCILSSAIDITARKKSEEILSTSEAQLKGFLNATPDAMIIVDAGGKIIMTNAQSEDLFGYENGELIGAAVEKLIPEEAHGRHKEHRAQFMQRPTSVTTEIDRNIVALRKNGEAFPAEISLSHHETRKGEKVFLCAIRDVTKQKQFEELIAVQRDLARLTSAHLPQEKAWKACLEAIISISGLDCGGIYLFNEPARQFELVSHENISDGFAKTVAQFAEDTPSAQMILYGKSHYFTETDLLTQKHHAKEGIRSVAVIPLHHKGQIIGCLNVASRGHESIPAHAREALAIVAVEVGNVIAHLRVEAALEASQKQLSQTLIAARMGTWRYEISTGRTSWSPEAASIFGIDYEEIDFNSVLARFHPDDRSRVTANLQEALKSKSLLSSEYRMLDSNGAIRWITNYGNIEFDKDGNPSAFVALLQDITERKQAEEALRKSEEKYRDLINGMNDTIWVIDHDLAILDVNKAASAILGYTREELLAMKVPEIDASLTDTHIQTLAESMSMDKVQIFETSHQTKEGRIIPVEVSSSLVSYAGRTVIMSIARDITERKRAEEELLLAERRYRALIEYATDGIVLINAEGKFKYISPSVERLFGYDQKEAMQRNPNDLTHPDDQPTVLLELAKLLEQPSYIPTLQYRFKHKNGEWRWIESTFSNLLATPNVEAIIINFHDIHERKLAEEELNKSQALLKEAQRIGRIGYMEWKGNDTPLICSDEIYNILDLPHGAIITRRLITEMMRPGEVERVRKLDMSAIQQRANMDYEYCILRNDGSERWIHQLGNVTYAENGAPVRMMAIIQDVTERRQAEENLREQMEDMALVNALNDAANRGEDLEKIIEILSQETRRILHCKDVGIYLLSPDGQSLIMQHSTLSEPLKNGIEKIIGRALPKVQIPIKPDSFFTRIINSDRGAITSDPETLQKWLLEFADTPFLTEAVRPAIKALAPQIFKVIGIQSVITIPLKTADQTLGAIEIASADLLSEHELERMQNVRASLTEIIKRKRVEQELMESEEKYRGLMGSLNNAISTVAYDGTFLFLNDMAAESLGENPAELLGKKIQDVFPAPFGARQLDAVQGVFHTDREFVIETPTMVKNGLRWFRVAFQPLHDEAGKVTQVLVNATDIHDLKTAQQELQELNRTLEEKVAKRTAEVQDLYDNAPTGYHSLDENGRFVKVNQTELNWLGYTREAMIGHPATDFVTEQSVRIIQENLALLKTRGWVHDQEIEFIRKDGSTLPVMVNATAVKDENGRCVSTRTTLTDITQRKHAEDELKRNVNFTTALLDAIPTPVFYTDKYGKYQGCNRAFSEIMGKTTDEIRGKTVDELWPSKETNVYRKMDLALLQNKERQVFESIVTDRNNNAIPVIFIKDIYYDEFGDIAGLVAAFIEITARKQAEETMRLANLELERSLRLKDEFLANMSHELRTPLNAILGISESLLEQFTGPLNLKQQKYVQTINESGKHLLELINDVLDLAKINAGRMELDIVKVSIPATAQSCLRMVRELAQKKNQDISINIDKMADIVWADERRIKQMLVNLLSNAVKFTGEGGRLGLDIKGDLENKILTFTVWDTGIGIAPKDLRLLFQPFIQLDAGLTRGAQGTGLGLALVSQMARLHGGGVSVETVPDQGSRFTISIPWVISGRTGPLGVRPAPIPQVGNPHENTILLVEDTEAVTMLTQDYLESHGYKVHTARNGIEGIAKAREIHPDLILMDVMMPEMDGLEATKRIRSEPGLDAVPIIALTALAMSGDREQCLAAGMNDYLSKPVNFHELLEVIELYLQVGHLFNKEEGKNE
jgi:PAS domain S-box-containing protein